MSTEPRRDRLDQPVEPGRVRLPRFNPETFGRWSENIARYMGTAQFIVWMTISIVAWFAWNRLAPGDLPFDPYPFQFLTLILSLQASYAAPLILLAQNRQADRDRTQVERDREINERTLADAEFLAREIAALRLGVSELPTARDVMRELEGLRGQVEEMRSRLEQPQV